MKKRIIWAVVFTIVFGFLGLIAVGFSLLMSAKNGYIYTGIIVVATLIAIDMLILGLPSRMPKRMAVVVIALIFTVPLLGYGGYEAYMNHIEIKNAEVDLTAYEPFEQDTKAVELEAPATFTITDNLPELDGATALYPVYSAFVQAVYPENSYPHVPGESEVVVSKTNGAYDRLVKQEVDMIFTAGPSSTQRSKLGEEMKMTPIGKEAFVFFVHESNPVDNLTIEQLQKIYSGEITNWDEVGGRNQAIIAFQRPEGSGSQTGLQNMMGGIPIMDPPTDQRVDGMGGIIEKTSDYRNHRNAIGYSYRFFATQMVENKGVKLLKIDGVSPDVPSIRDGEYPLTGEFFAITNGTENPNMEAFINWILSDQGQQLIEKTGYVPIH